MKKILAILLSLALLLPLCACSGSDYKKAEELLAQGRYEEAEAAFLALGDYQDSAERAKDCRYQQGLSLMAEGRYEEATELFKALAEATAVDDKPLVSFVQHIHHTGFHRAGTGCRQENASAVFRCIQEREHKLLIFKHNF